MLQNSFVPPPILASAVFRIQLHTRGKENSSRGYRSHLRLPPLDLCRAKICVEYNPTSQVASLRPRWQGYYSHRSHLAGRVGHRRDATHTAKGSSLLQGPVDMNTGQGL